MKSRIGVAALAVIVVVLGVSIALSGNSSKHPAQVLATLAPTAQPTTPTPTSRSASPRPRPTHVAPRRTPGSLYPTEDVAPVVPTALPVAACRLASGPQTIAGRTVILDLPSHFPAPVVVDYHGGNQNAVQEHGYTGLGPAGASRGFIVATPNGTGGSWNFPGTESLPDDAAFTRSIASTLASGGCSNGRVYTAGISDGADMAVAAACRVSVVRAVFAVAPSITPRGACVRKPFLEVYGTSDPIVPYYGRAGGSFGDTPSEPIASRLPFWTNGCTGPVTGPAPAAGTHVQRWTCAFGRIVELDTVNGGGHTWPGAVGPEPAAGLGARASWSADLAALAFFAAH